MGRTTQREDFTHNHKTMMQWNLFLLPYEKKFWKLCQRVISCLSMVRVSDIRGSNVAEHIRTKWDGTTHPPGIQCFFFTCLKGTGVTNNINKSCASFKCLRKS